MANYYGVIRSNYFHVKDEERFRALMARTAGDEDSIELWNDEIDENGNPVFGFGVYGGITGVVDEDGEYDDNSYDRFIEGLKECVADDDAILIFEAGHEKLRYVGGGATIITAKSVEYIDLEDCARSKARELLGNEQWNTKCSC